MVSAEKKLIQKEQLSGNVLRSSDEPSSSQQHTHTHTNLLTPDMAVVFLNKENMAQYSVILTFHTAFAVGKRRPQLSKLLKYDSNKCFLFFF